MKSKLSKRFFQIFVAFSEYLNFDPETPRLNLPLACSQNLLDFYAYCYTSYIHDNFSPIIKVGTEKLQTPLFEMKAGFLCSPDQRTIRLPSDFVLSFFFSDIVVCSITWSWVTYVSFQIIFWGIIQIHLCLYWRGFLVKFRYSEKATKISSFFHFLFDIT